MNAGMKATFVVVVIVGTLLLFFIGYRFIYRGNFRNNESPILKQPDEKADVNILYLHHSTGRLIWEGGIKDWFLSYNSNNGKNYSITEQGFPKSEPYGWKNYPYDYWNIWVNHAGEEPYKNEPTLEMITKFYDVVIFKHCFPVSAIEPDTGHPQISSDAKRIENYKLQYDALKEKMKTFSNTKFIIWTGAALVESSTDEEQAQRAKEFFNWVKDSWNEKGDNIYIWDFYELETEGSLYMRNDYAKSETNSHPTQDFSKRIAPMLCKRIVDVVEGRGESTNILGID